MSNPEFERLLFELINDLGAARPVQASMLGLTDWDSELPDMSASGILSRQAVEREWVARFEAVDETTLSPGRQIDRALVIARLGSETETADFEAWRRSPERYLENGVFSLFLHGARAEDEAVDAAVARLAKAADNLSAARLNVRPELAHPEILRRELASVAGQAAFLRNDVAKFVAEPRLRAKLQSAAAQVAPLYDELARAMEAMVATASGSFVFGAARYDIVLRRAELLDHNTATLLRAGWSQLEALEQQISEVAARVDPETTWFDVFSGSQAMHVSTMSDLVVEYRGLTARARDFVRSHGLMTLPPENSVPLSRPCRFKVRLRSRVTTLRHRSCREVAADSMSRSRP